MDFGVFSGGGSYGAEKVGVVYKTRPKFTKTFGISTGALIAPLAVLGEWEVLRNGYLNVRDSDIFSVDPFNKKGKLKLGNTIWRILRGKESLGNSDKLLYLIRSLYTVSMHNRIADRCEVGVYDTITSKLEFVNSRVSYMEFTEAMWHSANAPLAMSFDNHKTDGGLVELVPLSQAIKYANSGDRVLTYICREEFGEIIRMKAKNMLDVAMDYYFAMRREIEIKDVVVGKLEAKAKGVHIEIDWKHPLVKGSALRFSPEKMGEWFNIGYNKV
jgi:NTE family protein